jgi:hypothetical protein
MASPQNRKIRSAVIPTIPMLRVSVFQGLLVRIIIRVTPEILLRSILQGKFCSNLVVPACTEQFVHKEHPTKTHENAK